MEKHYVYRKHLRILQKAIPAVLGVLAALLALGIILLIVLLGEEDAVIKIAIAVTGGVGILFLAAEAAVIWFFFRRFANISVTLTEDTLIYKNIKGITKIPLDQIQRLEFPSVKYLGGWVKIVYPGGNIRLTVVLEKIGDLIKELKDALDKREKQSTYNSKTMFNFYKTATYSDQSWERLYEVFPKLVVACVLNLLIEIGACIATGQWQGMELWIAVSAVLPVLIWGIAELVMMAKSASMSFEYYFEVAPRDKSFEKKIYIAFFTLYAVLYLFATAVLLMC